MVDRDTALTLAIRALSAGRLDMARRACEEILDAVPEDASALHVLGLVSFAENDTDQAIGHLVRAASLSPRSTEIRSNLGLAFRAAGRPDAALEQFDRALGLTPDDPALLGEKAVCLIELAREDEALALLTEALAQRPNAAQLRNTLGNALRRLGRMDEAEVELLKAVEAEPDLTDAHLNMGLLMRETGRLDEALAFLSRAAELAPNSAEIAVQLGVALRAAGHRAEARLCFERAVAADLDHPDARNDLGLALLEDDEAEAAAIHLRAAVALAPGLAAAHANLGAALLDLADPDGAIEECDAAIVIAPDDPDARWNRALALLTKGDYENGFQAYESRWLQDRFKVLLRDRGAPQWDGGNIAGKRLLLTAEQGLGDTIQFARYATVLAGMGAEVVVEVQPAMKRLIATADGAARVIGRGEDWGVVDAHAPMASLPRLLGHATPDDVPAPVPYLRAEPARVAAWAERLERIEGFKIGICWRGSATNAWDARRSLPIEAFAGLADVSGVRLVSLQRDAGDDLARAKPGAVVDLGPDLDADGAFVDTAAVLPSLDLVITVDTALAHLAGALDRPAWVALAHVPDWRWGLSGKTTPWYPSLRLFRQPARGEWRPVLAELRERLTDLVDR